MSDSQTSRRRTPLKDFFFLDVLGDPRARPVLVYAGLSITLSAALYRWLEGWSWVDSFYFVIVTFTTIGYGDLVPTTTLSKFLTMFLSVNGVIVLLMVFDTVRQVRHWALPSSVRTSSETSPDQPSQR